MNIRIKAISFVIAIFLGNAYFNCSHADTPAPKAPVTPTVPSGGPREGDDLYWLKHQETDTQRRLDKLQATKASSKFVNDLHLVCELVDSRTAANGKTTVNGKSVVTAYEVACSNGMGYILASQDRKTPTVISCFDTGSVSNNISTEHIRESQESLSVSCRLPANVDTKAMAANLLKNLNTPCTVSSVSSLGLNTKRIEYIEVTCDNNVGYVLVIPQQGEPTAQISVMSCEDAAAHGVQCHLTANASTSSSAAAGPAPVTMQTLYDALKQNGVTCTSAKLQLRMIGREATKRRYVVETQCPEQPSGLIAYIPLEDNTNKFETINCNEALKRQITCQLNAK